MTKVAIIILHYGRWSDTQACLGSLKKLKKPGIKVAVVVVDNSGDKNIRKKLKQAFAKATYLTSRQNLGYAGGNNLGIRYALKKGAESILLLNNDTVVGPASLKRLVAAAEASPKVGIIGPTIKHKVGKQTFYDYGGVINWRLGKPWHINLTDNRSKHLFDRDFVSGCCMLVKAAVFEKIGLLNESYFLYLEDVEFCVRAKRAGFEVKLNPRAKIFHKGSRSVSQWHKIAYSWRNSLRFSLDYVAWPWKPIALSFNLAFYPLLLGMWQLKRLKRFMLN